MLAGSGAVEPDARTAPSARQAPGAGAQTGTPKIIGMARARRRLFQLNQAAGGEDSELQKKLLELKAIK